MDEHTELAPQYFPSEQSPPTNKIELAALPASENSAVVDLAINYDALSVSVRSQTNLGPELIELATQVRLLKEQLAESTAKVEEANYKIGFLQAQVLVQEEQIKELRQQSGLTLPKNGGIKTWFKSFLLPGRHQ